MAQNWDFMGLGIVFLGAIVFTNFLLKTKFGSLFFIIGNLLAVGLLIYGMYIFMTKK